MIMNKDAIVTASEIITGEDFYQQQYGIVFDTMVELFNEGKPVDLITLQDSFDGKRPAAGSIKYGICRRINEFFAYICQCKDLCGDCKEKSMLRKMIKTMEEITNTCYLGKERVQDIMEDTEKKIFDLVQRKSNEEFVPIRQVVLNANEKYEKSSRTKGSVREFRHGFVDLDYQMSGFPALSDLILVAARPSMGKLRLY